VSLKSKITSIQQESLPWRAVFVSRNTSSCKIAKVILSGELFTKLKKVKAVAESLKQKQLTITGAKPSALSYESVYGERDSKRYREQDKVMVTTCDIEAAINREDTSEKLESFR